MSNIYNSSENKNNILMLSSSLTLLLGKGKVSDASLKAMYFFFLTLVNIIC